MLVGAGKMGRAAGRELLEMTTARLLIYDIAAARADALVEALVMIKAEWRGRCTTVDGDAVAAPDSAIDGILLCVGWPATKAWLERLLDLDETRCFRGTIVSIARPNYADLVWLERKAEQCEAAVILPLGLEPGLVELLAGQVRQSIRNIRCLWTYCGGIPAAPKLPLCHTLFFGDRLATDDRPAWYVRSGVPSQAVRFADVQRVVVPGIGLLEAYHDGMMPTTAHDPSFSGLDRFEQRTLRWPGFVERIVQLKELRFFCDDELRLGNARITVSDFTHEVLRPLLVTAPTESDVAIVQIVAEDDEAARGTILLRCRGEPEITGLAQLTATAAVAALCAGSTLSGSGWLLPTAQVLAICVQPIMKRLNELKQVHLTASGILTHALAGFLEKAA
jgi:lysine 6-dehydrogenase